MYRRFYMKIYCFKNCTSLIRYFRFSEACLLEADLWSKLERNDFGAAYQVYLEAQERVLELKKDKALSRYRISSKHSKIVIWKLGCL